MCKYSVLSKTVSTVKKSQAPALAPSGGLIHAVADEGPRAIGISVGPISGRVTARRRAKPPSPGFTR